MHFAREGTIRVVSKILFADAEVGEDFTEDVVGGDFAGDFAEPVEALANVLVQQVAAQTAVQAVDGTGYGIAGVSQRLVVAGVGDDDGIAVHLGQDLVQLTLGGKFVVKVGLVEHDNEGLAVAV